MKKIFFSLLILVNAMVLLGQVWPQGAPPFVTIKTIDYRQWIGEQALVFCNDSNIVWDRTTDFSLYLNHMTDSRHQSKP